MASKDPAGRPARPRAPAPTLETIGGHHHCGFATSSSLPFPFFPLSPRPQYASIDVPDRHLSSTGAFKPLHKVPIRLR